MRATPTRPGCGRARWFGAPVARHARTQHRGRGAACEQVWPVDEFDAYKDELEAAERKVAGEIQPGGRALVVSILVFVLLVSFILPHTGAARGIDVPRRWREGGRSRCCVAVEGFSWLALVFGVGFSMLALLTRRWALAWVALAGSAVAVPIGMFAVWSRQTALHGHPGPGIGLILGWITVSALAFHWAKVVWTRTALQLAAERRASARGKRTAEQNSDGGTRPSLR